MGKVCRVNNRLEKEPKFGIEATSEKARYRDWYSLRLRERLLLIHRTPAMPMREKRLRALTMSAKASAK